MGADLDKFNESPIGRVTIDIIKCYMIVGVLIWISTLSK